MAKRLLFTPSINKKCKYTEEEIDFKYYTGFAISQKQKSVMSLHDAIKKKYPNINILEVSTKSLNPLGVRMSAFNLTLYNEVRDADIPIENIFQSSKVFKNGGPYRDLLYVHPKEAKRDERLKTSGELIGFNYQGEDWPLIPKSIFYDWIYINALCKLGIEDEIVKFDGFTDIEFNHERSINCQARAAALYCAIIKLGIANEVLTDVSEFKKLYGENTKEKQMSFL